MTTTRPWIPAESTEFDLTADVDDLELPDEDGVYLIGVQIRGRVAASDDEILGRGRIFMPLLAATDEESDPSRTRSRPTTTSYPSD